MSLNSINIKKSQALIRDADCILVAAGAGLSVAAGIDFKDSKSFSHMFPHLAQLGFKSHYFLFDNHHLSEKMKWAYYTTFVDHLNTLGVHPVYQDLLQLIQNKDYFVLTSNLESMFKKNSFDEDRLYTLQGQYDLVQCKKNCADMVWESKSLIGNLKKNIDPEKFEISEPALLPKCPLCGAEMAFNIRDGSWFTDKPYAIQKQRFESWLGEAKNKKLLILDLGTGFNTPMAIRWKMEKIVHQYPDAHLIRINSQEADLPTLIESKSISIQALLEDVLPKLLS